MAFCWVTKLLNKAFCCFGSTLANGSRSTGSATTNVNATRTVDEDENSCCSNRCWCFHAKHTHTHRLHANLHHPCCTTTNPVAPSSNNGSINSPSSSAVSSASTLTVHPSSSEAQSSSSCTRISMYVDEFAELHLLLQEFFTNDNTVDQLMKFLASQLPSDSSGTTFTYKDYSQDAELGFMPRCRQTGEKLVNIATVKDVRQTAAQALQSLDQAHWMHFVLVCIGAAADRMVSFRSKDKNCFRLLKILNTTARTLKDIQKSSSEDINHALKPAFEIIVENSVICFNYLSQKRLIRILKAKQMEQLLHEASNNLNSVLNSVCAKVQGEIVNRIENYVDTCSYYATPISELLKHPPVGFDDQIREVGEKLNIDGMEEAAVAVIICGTGGIGKSTLAKASLQSLLPSLTGKYKYARVQVDNTVMQGKQAHISSLQHQILCNVSQDTRKIPNPEEGRHALQQVLGKHSCLLFIDNVNDTGIIDQLLPQHLSLDSGVMLRIIITSRDPRVKVEVPSCCVPKICERQRLPDELAMQLLKSIVLGSTGHLLRFPEEIEKLNMIAQLCHGIPLLLTVVGGQLSQERVKSSYDQFIEKLQMGNVNFETINHEEIVGQELSSNS